MNRERVTVVLVIVALLALIGPEPASAGAPVPTVAGWTLTISPAHIDLSETTVLNVSGGGSPTSYTYNWSGLPFGCASVNASTLSCFPSVNGTFAIVVNVTAFNGTRTTVGPAALSVATYPTSNDLRTPWKGVAPLTVTFTDTATGGTPPYTWIWYFGDGSVGHQENMTHDYIQPGTFFGEGYAIDSLGVGSGFGWQIVVYAPPSVQIVANPGNLTLGQTLTVSASASGGAPGLRYAWTGMPPGCPSANVSTVRCTPQAAGTYAISVTVTDPYGQASSDGTTVTVTSPGLVFGPTTPSPILWIEIASLAGVAAVGATLYLLHVRRRRSPVPPGVPRRRDS